MIEPSDVAVSNRWFAVSTKPNCESQAETHLQRQAIETFCPRILVTRRHARRTETVPRPLFPGYLFIALAPETKPWRAVNGTFGVRHLLMTDGRPAEIFGNFVGELLERADSDGVITNSEKTYSVGDRVEVLAGPLTDQIAEIVSMPRKQRVEVLLCFLGGMVRSSVPLTHISPAT